MNSCNLTESMKKDYHYNCCSYILLNPNMQSLQWVLKLREHKKASKVYFRSNSNWYAINVICIYYV